jgi:hypothetical protein
MPMKLKLLFLATLVVGGVCAQAPEYGPAKGTLVIQGGGSADDPKVADTEEFAKILRDANGVWFDGGRKWNIVVSYANTLTLREFHKVLERGAIAGSEIVMTPEPEHEHGFAFVRKVAIDQHISTRLYQPWEKPYYVLSPGDVYNMKTRAIEKYGTGVVAPPAVLQK